MDLANKDIINDKIDLEEQFILRLPSREAETFREILHKRGKKAKKLLRISLDPLLSKGTVQIGNTSINGVLKPLPTCIDSYKTTDKVNLFKTADVSHILICDYNCNSQSEPEQDPNMKISTPAHPHGISPSLKNVKKKRFRKTLFNQDQALEVENIEKELLHLFKADSCAVSTRYEIIYDPEEKPVPTENVLFGNISSDSEEEFEGIKL